MTDLDGFSFWDATTEQINLERGLKTQALAQQAVEPLWPYLAAAATQTEFEHRLATAQPNLDRLIISVIPDASLEIDQFRVIAHRDLLARWEEANADATAAHLAGFFEHVKEKAHQFSQNHPDAYVDEDGNHVPHFPGQDPEQAKDEARKGHQPEIMPGLRGSKQSAFGPVVTWYRNKHTGTEIGIADGVLTAGVVYTPIASTENVYKANPTGEDGVHGTTLAGPEHWDQVGRYILGQSPMEIAKGSVPNPGEGGYETWRSSAKTASGVRQVVYQGTSADQEFNTSDAHTALQSVVGKYVEIVFYNEHGVGADHETGRVVGVENLVNGDFDWQREGADYVQPTEALHVYRITRLEEPVEVGQPRLFAAKIAAAGDNTSERTCTNQRCYHYGERVDADHTHTPLGKDSARVAVDRMLEAFNVTTGDPLRAPSGAGSQHGPRHHTQTPVDDGAVTVHLPASDRNRPGWGLGDFNKIQQEAPSSHHPKPHDQFSHMTPEQYRQYRHDHGGYDASLHTSATDLLCEDCGKGVKRAEAFQRGTLGDRPAAYCRTCAAKHGWLPDPLALQDLKEPKSVHAERTGPTMDDPNGYEYTPAPEWVQKACRHRFEGGGITGLDPKHPGHYLHGIGNTWDGPSEVKDNGDHTLSYTNPYTGDTDRFDETGYFDNGVHKTWGSAYDDYTTGSVEALLANATEQDWLEAEGAFFHDVTHHRDAQPPHPQATDERGEFLRGQHADEADEERESTRRHDDYWAAHPEEAQRHMQQNATRHQAEYSAYNWGYEKGQEARNGNGNPHLPTDTDTWSNEGGNGGPINWQTSDGSFARGFRDGLAGNPKQAGSFRDMLSEFDKVSDTGTCKHCGKSIEKKGTLWYATGEPAAADICIQNKGTRTQFGGAHEPGKKKTSAADSGQQCPSCRQYEVHHYDDHGGYNYCSNCDWSDHPERAHTGAKTAADSWAVGDRLRNNQTGKVFEITRISPPGAAGTRASDGPTYHAQIVKDDKVDPRGFAVDIWSGATTSPTSAFSKQAVNESAYGTERYQPQPTITQPDWTVDEWGPEGRVTKERTEEGRGGYEKKKSPFADTLTTTRDVRTAALRIVADMEPGEDGGARTTRPRQTPPADKPDMVTVETEILPGQMGGGGGFDAGYGADPSFGGGSDLTQQVSVDPSMPTVDQMVAAKVATLTRRVLMDNPTMAEAQARAVAAKTLATYPEMVKVQR